MVAIPRNPCTLSSAQLKRLSARMPKSKKYNKTTSQAVKYLAAKRTPVPVVPLTICQVWHNDDLTPAVRESIQRLKEQNPEFKHELFNEPKCEAFIEKHFPKRVLDAYHAVTPHALKADLFRYCYLYKNGGFYLDVKYYGINGFKLILLSDKEHFCKDAGISFHGIYNAFIVCKPNNPIMKQTIDAFVKNVETHYYGPHALCIGPLMMKQFFSEKQLNDIELTHEYVNTTNRFILWNGFRVLKYHEQYSKEKLQKTKHWAQAWKNKTMYRNTRKQRKGGSAYYYDYNTKPLLFTEPSNRIHGGAFGFGDLRYNLLPTPVVDTARNIGHSVSNIGNAMVGAYPSTDPNWRVQPL